MKNLKLLFSLFLFNIFNLTLVFAQGGLDDDGDYCPSCPPPPTDAPGNPATPIDEYTIILIVAGIVIASGLYFYRNSLQVKTK